MARPAEYDASTMGLAQEIADPYLRPSFSLGNRLLRLLWAIVHVLLYRTSPVPLHAWRSFLLRCFGASMGPACHFYPSSRVWAPWNLYCQDQVTAANGVEIYNPAPMRFGSHVILSQGAYLCGATHDYDRADFPLLAYEMRFGAYAWICARAAVAPGVQVAEGAVLGLGAVATRSLHAWTVYGGNPAVALKSRIRTQVGDPPPTEPE
ncbi:MAG: putative colanic acid biosynthesis acetyltransferase [Janthinobacterium lividum]